MSFSARQISPTLRSPTRVESNVAASTLVGRSCRRTAVWLLAAVLVLLDAAATKGEILIESRIGFHGVFQLGRPFPVEVELHNTGRPAEGVLDVQIWKGGATKGGAPYAANYRREIFLPGQSRKVVQLTVDPDFLSRPMVIRFSGPTASAVREIDLRRHFSPTPVLLLLSGSALPTIALGASSTRMVSLTPAELAGDARALLGVSHMILYDQSLRELSRAQALALDDWITAGGQLLVAASINYALYQEPALARLLPVRVDGVRQIAFKAEAEKGRAAKTLTSAWAQNSTVTKGKVLAQSEGVPVLVEANHGRGRILYFALDIGRPPLAGWEGLAKYLQTLLGPAQGGELPPRTDWGDAVFNQLIASPRFIATYIPSGALFVALLVYLAGLAALCRLWQKRRLGARAVVIALALWVSVGSAAGYLHFRQGGNIPDGVLLVSTVLENNAGGYADAQANLALFSTQLRSYDLELERGWLDLTPVASRARDQTEPAIVTQEPNGASRYRLPLREWDYRLFRMRRVERLPFAAELSVEGDQVVLKIDNRGGKELVQCWLLVPGRRFDLGTIARGAVWQRNFPVEQTGGKEEPGRLDALRLRELSFADKTRDILFQSSMFPRDGDGRWSSGTAAVFIGWVKEPEQRVRIDDSRIQMQEYTLFRAVATLPGPDDE